MSDDSANQAKALAAPVGSWIKLTNYWGVRPTIDGKIDGKVEFRFEWKGRTIVYVSLEDTYTTFSSECPGEWSPPTLRDLLIEYERVAKELQSWHLGDNRWSLQERLEAVRVRLLIEAHNLFCGLVNYRHSERQLQDVLLWATWNGPKDMPAWLHKKGPEK